MLWIAPFRGSNELRLVIRLDFHRWLFRIPDRPVPLASLTSLWKRSAKMKTAHSIAPPPTVLSGAPQPDRYHSPDRTLGALIAGLIASSLPNSPWPTPLMSRATTSLRSWPKSSTRTRTKRLVRGFASRFVLIASKDSSVKKKRLSFATFLYQNGAITMLPPPETTGDSWGDGINDAGVIIGTANFGTTQSGGIYNGGNWVRIYSPISQSDITGLSSINSNGWIVGEFSHKPSKGADIFDLFLYKNGKSTRLYFPAVFADAPKMNTSGQIIEDTAGKDNDYATANVTSIRTVIGTF